MGKYISSVSEMSWRHLERRAPVYTVDHAIEQWLQSKFPVYSADPKLWQWINAGLIYVLKKVLGPAAHMLQVGFMGALTLADMIAWALRRGIELFEQTSKWVNLLMRKIMQALGMKLIDSAKDLSQALMRRVLMRLMQRIDEEAKKAIYRIR